MHMEEQTDMTEANILSFFLSFFLILTSHCRCREAFPKLLCSRTPFWFRKIATDPQILARVNSVRITGIQN